MSGSINTWMINDGEQMNDEDWSQELEKIAKEIEKNIPKGWGEKKVTRVKLDSRVIEIYTQMSDWRWVRIIRAVGKKNTIEVRYQTEKTSRVDIAIIDGCLTRLGFKKVN
jgi:hypothetical protein